MILTSALNRLFSFFLPQPNSRNTLPKPYSFLLFLSLLCAPLQSYAEPFAEYYLLKKYKNFIQKNKKGYLFTDRSGAKLQLQRCPDPRNCETQHYSIVDVVNDRYFVFMLGVWEPDYFEIYDLNNGEASKTKDFPQFSPNLARIVSVSSGQHYPSIDIYELQGNVFKDIVDSLDLEEYTKLLIPNYPNGYIGFNPTFYSWDGDNQFRVRKEYEEGNMVDDLIFSFDNNLKKWSYKKAAKPFPLKNNMTDFTHTFPDITNRFPDIMNSFSDKKIVLSFLEEEGANAKYLDKKLFDDEEVMTAAIKSHYSNVAYLSPRLKDDLKFMNWALKQSRSTFQFASQRLRGDKNFAIKAMNRGYNFLSYASDELRDDEELLKIAIARDDKAFLYASQRIKDKTTSSLEFAKSLLAINCKVLTHFPEKLRDNKDLILGCAAKK